MDTTIIIDRASGRTLEEPSFKQGILDYAYRSTLARPLLAFLSSKAFAKLYALKLDSQRSCDDILPFIDEQRIDMSEFHKGPFRSFNDFFIRPFLPGKRPFDETPELLCAGAEASYCAYDLSSKDQRFPIKGHNLPLSELIGDPKLADEFLGGTLLIARLAPRDYHRFHFIDDGSTNSEFKVKGPLYSVGQRYLAKRPKTLFQNERHVSVLATKNFGKVLHIDVGGMAIGKIINSHPKGCPFKRGDEKGYFQFGASTVIWVFKKDAVTVDKDLQKNSQNNIETFIKLGTPIGRVRTNRHKDHP